MNDIVIRDPDKCSICGKYHWSDCCHVSCDICGQPLHPSDGPFSIGPGMCRHSHCSPDALLKSNHRLHEHITALENALREAKEVLQMCREVEGTNSASYDPEEYNQAIDKALQTLSALNIK